MIPVKNVEHGWQVVDGKMRPWERKQNMEHVHSNSKLYPCSIYRCTVCGTLHGTRACNGAVNWQCPNELFSGTPESHKPAKQEYIGYRCHCGEIIDMRQAVNHAGVGFVLSAQEREAVR